MARYKRVKRKTVLERLESKVARARKPSSKRYWMKRLESYAMGVGRRQSRTARRRRY